MRNSLEEILRQQVVRQQVLLAEAAIRLREHLSMVDICTLFMLVLYAILGVFHYDKVDYPGITVAVNLTLSIALVGLALADGYAPSQSVTLVRKFFLLPGVFFVYAQAHVFIQHVNPTDVDAVLIKLDYSIWGTHPTRWAAQFAHPVLTEILQVCYFLYFWIPLFLGLELYARKDMHAFMYYAFVLAFGFYISYLLYFLAPAVGPRLTLHDFSRYQTELPGLWLTPVLRGIVDHGTGIANSVNPFLTAHRDCMPSGHTMITIINVVTAFRVRSSARWLFVVIGVGIVLSTIYLRYHYTVDVMAGVFWAILTLAAAPRLRAWFLRKGFKQA